LELVDSCVIGIVLLVKSFYIITAMKPT